VKQLKEGQGTFRESGLRGGKLPRKVQKGLLPEILIKQYSFIIFQRTKLYGISVIFMNGILLITSSACCYVIAFVWTHSGTAWMTPPL
jgi:hypothetical protein